MIEYVKITSRKNEAVMTAASLKKNKGRNEENAFFTEGLKLFEEAVGAGFVPRAVFVTEEFLRSRGGEKFKRLNTSQKNYEITRQVYEKISDEDAFEGIFAVFDKFEIAPSKNSISLILENIQDPGNLGTILRSAAALGAREVVGVGCADVFSPKTVRSTMGAIFRMPYKNFDNIENAVEYISKTHGKIYAATLTPCAVDVMSVDTSHAAVMIGNEGHGLSDKAISLSQKQIIIPIEAVESLNASAAATVILYDSFLKRGKKIDG